MKGLQQTASAQQGKHMPHMSPHAMVTVEGGGWGWEMDRKWQTVSSEGAEEWLENQSELRLAEISVGAFEPAWHRSRSEAVPESERRRGLGGGQGGVTAGQCGPLVFTSVT